MKRPSTGHQLGINQTVIFIIFKYVSPCTFLYSTLQFYSGKKLEGGEKGKGKAIPLQAWTGPEASSRLRHQDL